MLYDTISHIMSYHCYTVSYHMVSHHTADNVSHYVPLLCHTLRHVTSLYTMWHSFTLDHATLHHAVFHYVALHSVDIIEYCVYHDVALHAALSYYSMSCYAIIHPISCRSRLCFHVFALLHTISRLYTMCSHLQFCSSYYRLQSEEVLQ